MNEIETKNNDYVRASVKRIQYLLTNDKELKGKLVNILKNLFILVFKKDNKIFDHLFFMIFVFIYYNIQYYVTNTMVAFFLYNLILLVLIYIGRVKNGKQKAENN